MARPVQACSSFYKQRCKVGRAVWRRVSTTINAPLAYARRPLKPLHLPDLQS